MRRRVFVPWGSSKALPVFTPPPMQTPPPAPAPVEVLTSY